MIIVLKYKYNSVNKINGQKCNLYLYNFDTLIKQMKLTLSIKYLIIFGLYTER